MLETSQSDLVLTPKDFERIKSLIYQKAGINIQQGKQAMVYSRISRRVRAANFLSIEEYLNNLEHTNDAYEWQEFINALTTNLTSFFRESHHFDILKENLKRGDAPKIWCAAASTGEEPYSIAITVNEALGINSSCKLTCTDIDTHVLTKCKVGIYKVDSSGLTEDLKKKYFMKGGGKNSGFMKVKPELSRLTDFKTLNLIAPKWDLNGPFDFVFCRNVMIYFDQETQLKVLRKIHAQLKPGGLLFVGHSENFASHKELFKFIGKTTYLKI